MLTIVDIETGPLPNLTPPEFEAPSNYKDPEKIAAHKERQREAWIRDAALSALTGQILAIGYMDKKSISFYGNDPSVGFDEKHLVATFWTLWDEPGDLCGFAIKSFDLPFIIQRSLILGVPVSPDIFDGRYWSRRIVDLQERWLCYGRNSEGHSLANICKACGLGEKTGNGAEFSRLWNEDRDGAIAYLKNDLHLTNKLAQRMGL